MTPQPVAEIDDADLRGAYAALLRSATVAKQLAAHSLVANPHPSSTLTFASETSGTAAFQTANLDK